MRVRLITTSVTHGPRPQDRFEIGDELTEKHLPAEQLQALVDCGAAEAVADDFEEAFSAFQSSSADTLLRLEHLVDCAEQASLDDVMAFHQLLASHSESRQDIGARMEALFARAVAAAREAAGFEGAEGDERDDQDDLREGGGAGAGDGSAAPKPPTEDEARLLGQEAGGGAAPSADQAQGQTNNSAEPGAGVAEGAGSPIAEAPAAPTPPPAGKAGGGKAKAPAATASKTQELP